jgi:pimeloyl-ACP methyl ester carboxylesterase
MNKISVILLFFTSQLLQCHQPMTLFCHGIVDNKNQIDRYQHVIMQPATSFDFPDAQKPADWDLNTLVFNGCSLFGKSVNRNNMFMGTGQDITTLKKQIDPKKSYILYGLSRGGAAAITYLAQYNPSNIQALILESTPADMIDAVDNFQYAIGYKFAQERPTQELIFHTLFPAYQLGSIPPIQSIAHIQNKQLPVFIVHTQDDTRVSIDAAYKLYLALKQANFTDVYLCILDHGKHGLYTQGPDKNIYLHALHSFYKKYGFAYHQQFATLNDLAILQPPVDQVLKKLALYQHHKKTNYLTQKYFNQKIALLATAGSVIFGLGWHLHVENLEKIKKT